MKDRKEYMKEYQEKNKLILKEKRKIYNINRKEEQKQYQKKYRLNHKKERKIYNMQYREKNNININIYSMLWYYKNKENHIISQKKYEFKNKDKRKESRIKWLEKNPNYYKEYQRNRKNEDIEYRLLVNLRSRLNVALKGKCKSKRTMKLIGCSIEFLKQHIEYQFLNGMTWENYGEWVVDHIIPCCSFNLEKEEEQKKCFHYSNLQPLWWQDNRQKSYRIYFPEDIIEQGVKI